MSYPQLFNLRKILTEVKDLVLGDGFIQSNEGVIVNPNYSDPIVFDGIGKGNKWMAFKLVSIEDTEEGIKKIVPAVSIELSDSNGAASVLTINEILTIYTIVNDLDLMNFQTQMSIAFLMGQDSQIGTSMPTQIPQPAPYQSYQPYQQPQQFQPQQNFGGNNYGNGGGYNYGRQNQQTQPYQGGYRAVPKTSRIPTNSGATPVYNTPVSSQATAAPTQSAPQTRTESSILNLKNVEAAPQTDFIYGDDEEAIDAIFNNK